MFSNVNTDAKFLPFANCQQYLPRKRRDEVKGISEPCWTAEQGGERSGGAGRGGASVLTHDNERNEGPPLKDHKKDEGECEEDVEERIVKRTEGN